MLTAIARSRPSHRALAFAAAAVVVALVAGAPGTAAAVVQATLEPVGSIALGGSTAAEIVAYDPTTRRAFVTNEVDDTIDVVDLSTPSAPVRVQRISYPTGSTIQGVDVGGGVLAAALQPASQTDPGNVAFFRTDTGAPIRTVTVGVLPDAVTFTPDGTRLLVANEGQPVCNGADPALATDPEGSVSEITVATGAVRTYGFGAFDAQRAALVADGVRLNFPGARVSQDLEPEYVAISADDTRAYVTLQENDAVAVLDLAAGTVLAVEGLSTKDHNLPGNGLDPSDRDAADNGRRIGIANRPVNGLPMPDGIATFAVGGTPYLVTANEGDGRDYPCFSDEVRVGAATLDPAVFPNAATLKGDGPDGIGRLTISRTDGDTDGDGDFDRLFAFGTRSMQVRTTDGTLVADTGDLLEQLTAARFPALFNSDGDTASSFDTRSDNKGPEPESVVVGTVGGAPLAFLALERIGGVAAFDLTDPAAPALVDYVNPRAENLPVGSADRAPEGLEFVPAATSPNGVPLLLVANEVSGTMTVYEVRQPPAAVIPEAPVAALLPAVAALAALGAIAGRRRRTA